jgi:2-phospho-L-lactate/phosphoenolpyruvate guanylyltransferase
MTESALFTWTVVMPVKVLAHAKSRLAVLAGSRRPDLALAFASDTVTAVLACPEVARVVVVTSDLAAARRLTVLGAVVVPDEPPVVSDEPPVVSDEPPVVSDEPEDGLNAALCHGAAVAFRRWPGGGVAALAADLPALRPLELSRALRAAAAFPSSFVPDAAGIGTTMYATVPGEVFRPMFGGASRARHASGGVTELTVDEIPGLRRDVDTPDDLRAAIALGAGFRTTALAGELLAAS